MADMPPLVVTGWEAWPSIPGYILLASDQLGWSEI